MSSISSLFPSLSPPSPPSAQNSGLAAIAAGNQKLDEDAQQIANPGSPNVTGALVDLNQTRVLTEAGADLISTENSMLGSLFDAFA